MTARDTTGSTLRSDTSPTSGAADHPCGRGCYTVGAGERCVANDDAEYSAPVEFAQEQARLF
jgi:hypothetical protein